MTGAERQWQLNRQNFEGRWQGPTRWYGRNAQGVLDLERPELELPHSTYTIRFDSPSSGSWHGVGLRFAPGGERLLPLSASTYNQGGSCWQFPAAGGQSSLVVPPQAAGEAAGARFGHEINLFQGRSRTMLVALWLPQPQAPAGARPWRLDQLAVTPFRCSLAAMDPARPAVEQPLQQLEQLQGWAGELERLEPGRWPERDQPGQACTPFDPADFASQTLTAGFADGLIVSLPEWLPQGAFRLEVGCLLGPQQFRRISVLFDATGQLEAWERRTYRCASASS
ncbi:hypothetical protein [Cyanobium sp. NIES-981]|uniref:hypothetical protein n=1 Tax=Cyanobium sp. NIES-981 TaxID=1851505 RepID=UPI0007DDC129|nr:hypothetical protein [Cyanobium sp. NIES-981]SBO42488.1 conserved protein of unknown function [Cyanobium sp. NIES-981]